MPTTTNFGWTTPADTDLVKDGALAIRTLGNGIDTSLLDLKGGTTGQNLRKNSNTDLDFTWAGDATNTVIDAEGDLLIGDSADTLQRLAIGTNGHVLTVDTAVDGKVKWAAAAGGKVVQVVTGALTTTATTTSTSFTDTGLSVTITPSNASNEILLFVSLAATCDGSGAAAFYTLADGSNNNLINATSPGSRRPAFARIEATSTDKYSMNGIALVFKHAPATTSAVTYKIRHAVSSTVTSLINRIADDTDNNGFSRGVSTIIAMEVTP